MSQTFIHSQTYIELVVGTAAASTPLELAAALDLKRQKHGNNVPTSHLQ